MPDTFPCPTCGKEFPTHLKMVGHIGGAHGKISWGPRAKGHPIVHGTRRGYLQHRAHKVTLDGCGCRAANARYMSDWRAKRKAWGPRS